METLPRHRFLLWQQRGTDVIPNRSGSVAAGSLKAVHSHRLTLDGADRQTRRQWHEGRRLRTLGDLRGTRPDPRDTQLRRAVPLVRMAGVACWGLPLAGALLVAASLAYVADQRIEGVAHLQFVGVETFNSAAVAGPPVSAGTTVNLQQGGASRWVMLSYVDVLGNRLAYECLIKVDVLAPQILEIRAPDLTELDRLITELPCGDLVAPALGPA